MRRKQARKDDNPQKIPQEDADETPRRATPVAYRRWLLRRPLPALTKMLHLKAVERHLADPDGSARAGRLRAVAAWARRSAAVARRR